MIEDKILKINKIDHIGIAVKSLDDVKTFYSNVLKLDAFDVEEVESQGVKILAFKVGDSKIEFLEAIKDDSPIKKFVEKKGSGIHHIAYEVDNIEEALDELESEGVVLIDKKPRRGLHNKKIAFLHPKSSSGILTELVEK
ncbi:MAG: methylmalonyl-CoA epimerase [Candidatus Schekmanbacteria bacterium]|nr:MAG: methylmalonyl-CoA epimerase [Candidatus Schekmanbacteria bacterium]